ncbi:MAG TPA: efflux RND transporter periplasmic adaptor subunit [Spirochaetia bacterium]|nr:efflux RND transporter periplasmic adaptor subunit [Spirochaetia bacterium]
MKHVHLRLIIGFGVIALVLAGCAPTPDAASEATAREVMEQDAAMGPVSVEAVEIARDRLIGDVTANGLIRGSREVTVVSETQGIIEEVGFALGESVTEGSVIVTLDDTIQSLAVAEAREAVSTAELDLAAAERLVSSGNAPQVQLTRARATLAGARARLAQAEKARNDRTIESPIEGLVATMDSSIQAGNSITVGAPIARIVDTNELEIMLSLGEREIQYVADGAPAYVSLAAAGEAEMRGYVHSIAAGSDPATGSFPVVVRWRNTIGSRARSGLSASVRIPPVGAPVALTVPANAVREAGTERYVYVASNDGFARRRIVETGARYGDRLVVTRGVEPGDQVIVSGLGNIADGSRVAVTLRLANQ